MSGASSKTTRWSVRRCRHSLAASKFDWGEYRQVFRVRMFHDVGRLDPGDGTEGEWYTSRARFNSQIPLEYAYAAWNQSATTI